MSCLSDVEKSPELPLSELCVNLEDKFESVQDVSKEESMNVYARIRPMLDSEKEAGYKECVAVIDEQVVRAIAPSTSSKFKISSHLYQDIIEDFTFTAAYGPETGQFVFFEECMKDTIKSFIEGQNNLVFSYGTTGSGKTFTLQGNVDNPGIIPLSLHLFFASVENQLLDKIFFKPDKFSDIVALNDNDIKKELEAKEQLLSSCNKEEKNFKNTSSKSLGMLLCETFSDHFEGEARETTLGPEEMAQAQAAALVKDISKKSAQQQSGYCSIWISFVEIYNETIYDLLQPNLNQRTKLSFGEDKNGDVYIKGLREVCVSSSHEALNLLNFGQKNLRIASTKLNYQSSRSHCIFTVKVIRFPDPDNMTFAKVNRLSFCDLAGSERAAKSQTVGMRLKEAGCINTSLLVLGRCLEQLRLNPSQRDKKLIPFRESKLTRLFSGFFTGRGKAVMITNASPSELTFDETLHVLRFSAVAKELIINDNYITTASSTLQSIANMWTDVRTNCKNQSQFSNKSISFEDSLDEVLQEKDELIEKLLDLAESLKNNLEKEKKDKAEMEMRIRQDACIEYTAFRDELLEVQKLAFEEEKDAIQEIYEKRIASLKKYYEKIITDFKAQSEDSFTTDDEAIKDAVQIPDEVKQHDISENASENEVSKNTDSHFKCNDAALKLSKETEEELLKTVDYSLSLEVELEHLRKKYESAQSMIEDTIKENDDLKKELDAYKTDVLAFKTDNEALLNQKIDLETDLKAFREDLVTVTQDKEVLFQELAESNDKLCCLHNEISKLLKSINELTLEKEESDTKYKKSLEEIITKNQNLSDELVAMSEELKAEKKKNEELKSLISAIEQENVKFKDTVESLTTELDSLKDEKVTLKEQLKVTEASIAASLQSENGTNNEIVKLKAVHLEEMKKMNDVLKKHEADAKEAEEVLRSVNKILGNSQEAIEQQKKEMNILEEECKSLKKELLQEQSTKNDILEKLQTFTSSLEQLEKQQRFELDKEIEKNQVQTAKLDLLQSDYLACKNEVANLKEIKLELEKKLLLASQECESAINFTQQLEIERRNLKEALNTINSQKEEIEQLKCEKTKCIDELVRLEKEKKELEHKFDSISSQNEARMNFDQQLESEASKLKEALSNINAQKEEIEQLKCEKKKCIDELVRHEKEKKKLEDKLDSISSENEPGMHFAQQLESESSKLKEALSTINAQKEEMERLMCEKKKCLDELVRLKKEKRDLEDKFDSISSQNESAMNFTQQLESESSKLKEALNTISSSKEEMQECLDKLARLEKEKRDLEVKLDSISSQNGIHHLLLVLENCEAEATHKIEELMSNIEQLKEKNETNSIKHEKKCAVLHELIVILEKCEAFASNKIKDFHSTNIKFVEQIMDLKNSLKSKEKIIAILNSDVKDIQKNYKDLQASSKKQLQIETQKLNSEIEKMKMQLTNFKKLNESLKCDLAKLEAEKDKIENECKNMKDETARKSNENQENRRRNRKTAEELENSTENQEQKSEIFKNQENRRRNRKTAEELENSTENQEQKPEIFKIPEEKRRNRRTADQSENCSEDSKVKKEISEIPENERRNNKKAIKRSRSAAECKKIKTEIYEESDENSCSENTRREKKAGRKHLGCLSNIAGEQGIKKEEELSKNRTSKRKADTNECKSPDKKTFKKIKMHSFNDAENSNKPQNLRLMLLKNSANVNDIPLPSPRMTRGRKRLVLAKEQSASPRSVRS